MTCNGPGVCEVSLAHAAVCWLVQVNGGQEEQDMCDGCSYAEPQGSCPPVITGWILPNHEKYSWTGF